MLKRRVTFGFLILLSIILTSFFIFNVVQANPDNNIRGLASSSLGYISFNCLDDDFFGKFTMMFPFFFNIDPCSLSQHGVHLDDNNNLSGEAWSPAIGFISFDSQATPDAPNYNFNANCLDQCDASNDCIACYNYMTQRIHGWAYRSSDSTWINLDSESPPVMMSNFAASSPGIFSGYADSDFGQISFNCNIEGTCGTADYKVYMWKLQLQEMSAPNWSFAEACNSSAQRVVFKWIRKSGTQTAYRIIVSETNDPDAAVFDSGKLSGQALQFVCPSANCDWTPDYNTSYYWWLQMWDAEDEPTELFQFNRDTYGILTDNVIHNDDQSSQPRLTFTSYKHEFPNPFFTWSPLDILVGEPVNFVSDASYYTSASPSSNPQGCINDGDCDFLWTVSNPDTAEIEDPYGHSTEILFTDNVPQIITLSVTDPDSYVCSYSSPVLSINFQLPLWREIAPQ